MTYELEAVLENRAYLSREVKRMRNALYAVLLLAEMPDMPEVVAREIREVVRKGLGHMTLELDTAAAIDPDLGGQP